MILVVLGTNDKPFDRLLQACEKLQLNEEIIVQAGETKFESSQMKVFDLIPFDEFDRLMDQARIVITHAGVGTILSALKKRKKVIACARLAKYGEHVNDHQIEIMEQFEKDGYLIAMRDFSTLPQLIEECERFEPRIYESSTDKVIAEIRNFIQQN